MITTNDIQRTVSYSAFQAGKRYFEEGRVNDVRRAPDGSGITATVSGTGPKPYRQKIRSMSRLAATVLAGTCTCPVGINCKHVAAALFECVKEGINLEPGPGDAITAVENAEQPVALPEGLTQWFDILDAAHAADTEAYPAKTRKRLLYVLGPVLEPGVQSVSLETADLKGDTLVPTGTRPTYEMLLREPGTRQAPLYVRPSDRVIVRWLRAFDYRQTEFIETLRRIFATGRGRWASATGPVLSEGDPLRGELAWDLSSTGHQRPTIVMPGGLVALRLAVPWYVDLATGVMGQIETGVPARVARAILASPAIDPAVAARVRGELGQRWPEASLPAPRALPAPKLAGGKPEPHLLLTAGRLPFNPANAGKYSYQHRGELYDVPLARLSFRYQSIPLPEDAGRQPTLLTQYGGELFQIVRSLPGERKLQQGASDDGFMDAGHLAAYYGFRSPPGSLYRPDETSWIDYLLHDVPVLRDQGWHIEVADDFPLKLLEPTGDLSFEIKEGAGIDWFDLDFGVVVDGERINLIPALLDLIGKPGALPGLDGSDGEADSLLLRLDQHRVLRVPLAQLRPIIAPLLELFGNAAGVAAGALRLNRLDAGSVALLEAATANAGVVWTGGDAIRALGQQLRDHGGIPHCPLPAGFEATLRPYQAHGLNWLQFLREAGLGGVLADDMGLGKTVQTLAHLAAEQAAGRLTRPALIVCPTSLVPNWRAEAARFAPRLRVLVLHGPTRAQLFEAIAAHDLVITTYPLLARDHAVLTAQDWHIVALDEAQMIKNPLATTSKLARTLRASQRLCLSGTPLENHLGELWSLFDFLMPGFLGDRVKFGRSFRTPIEKGGDTLRQGMLARRVAPFLLRRTKGEVASELPPKTEITETVEMEAGQSAIYEAIRLAMHAKVRQAVAQRGLAGSGIVILDAMLKLRQACCDPRLLPLTTAKAAKAGSAKLERLLELLPQMIEEGRRVLLFSQFTSMLALIEAELAKLTLPYVMLTGDTKDRATPVQQFQAGAVPLFLISLKAGGTGLNLTAADTVIHYDPWWNPAAEDQATDRAHRIGQDKKVFVHRLITSGTIEEKMQVLKQRKQALADGVLGAGAGVASALTEGDLEALFAPIG